MLRVIFFILFFYYWLQKVYKIVNLKIEYAKLTKLMN